MNKGDLINAVASASNTKPAEAKVAVELFSSIFRLALLSGDEVTLPGVGKLKVHTRPARTGRNPKTGEPIEIQSKRVVKFTPAAAFEEEFSVVVED